VPVFAACSVNVGRADRIDFAKATFAEKRATRFDGVFACLPVQGQ